MNEKPSQPRRAHEVSHELSREACTLWIRTLKEPLQEITLKGTLKRTTGAYTAASGHQGRMDFRPLSGRYRRSLRGLQSNSRSRRDSLHPLAPPNLKIRHSDRVLQKLSTFAASVQDSVPPNMQANSTSFLHLLCFACGKRHPRQGPTDSNMR